MWGMTLCFLDHIRWDMEESNEFSFISFIFNLFKSTHLSCSTEFQFFCFVLFFLLILEWKTKIKEKPFYFNQHFSTSFEFFILFFHSFLYTCVCVCFFRRGCVRALYLLCCQWYWHMLQSGLTGTNKWAYKIRCKVKHTHGFKNRGHPHIPLVSHVACPATI